MLLTIAIPCYNNRRTISKAIDSALNQNYDSEYEVLVVDNASTDGTSEVIARYNSPKLRVVTNPTTINIFQNHNVCLREAKGDYVVFCHSDDELMPQALRVLEHKIKERQFPDRYILWGRSMYRDYSTNLRRINYQQDTILTGEDAVHFFIMRPWGLTPSGTCYSRHSTVERGGFDEDMVSPLVPHDWTILIKSAMNCFEFEQMNRLILKRFSASTAKDSNSELVTMEAHHYAIELFLNSLSDSYRSNTIDYIVSHCNMDEFEYWKPFLSQKQRYGLYRKFAGRNPKRLYNLYSFFFR